ncbi:asparaginase [Uliginosibacterium gangwonense]|uniref:asparaginase n=1 Tax=Uliginosibacterium gangwonense TaxID=392736 RepID=UPI0012F77035|nr:asparaginase [Uliginosibacterium gangwonense]
MPRLALIATGGTIAGTGAQSHYTAATLPVDALLDAVPDLRSLAQWHTEQPFALDSRDMHPTHWLQLAERIQTLIDTPDIDGIVITHGTDTLEETAFALHLLLPTGKPVVITAAMRPADSLSADGPLNLLQAARVALAPHSYGRGVLVVVNDHILPARHVVKTHTHAPDALSAGAAGEEGIVFDQAVRYHRPAPIPRPAILTLKPTTNLPRVDILMAYAGLSADHFHALQNLGCRGIVLALAGHGSIPEALRPAISEAIAQGIVIVRASRIGASVLPNHNEDDSSLGTLAAEQLSPLQARIALMVGLAAGVAPSGLQAWLASV